MHTSKACSHIREKTCKRFKLFGDCHPQKEMVSQMRKTHQCPIWLNVNTLESYYWTMVEWPQFQERPSSNKSVIRMSVNDEMIRQKETDSVNLRFTCLCYMKICSIMVWLEIPYRNSWNFFPR